MYFSVTDRIKITTYPDSVPPYFLIGTPEGSVTVAMRNFRRLDGEMGQEDYELAMFFARKNMALLVTGGRKAMARSQLTGSGRDLPRIAAAIPLDFRWVRVVWQAGHTQDIDLAPALLSHRDFVRLRLDDALFQTLDVDEYGDALVWDDGAELSALWIDELSLTSLSNADFRNAMDILQMSLEGMAVRLGISRTLIAEYRKNRPLPPYVALATSYLVERQRRAR